MINYNFSLDQVFNMGYYEAHRLWLISSEIRFRDLEYLSKVFDYSNGTTESRGEFIEWIQRNQPRRYSAKLSIPKEVLEKFSKAFKANKRR